MPRNSNGQEEAHHDEPVSESEEEEGSARSSSNGEDEEEETNGSSNEEENTSGGSGGGHGNDALTAPSSGEDDDDGEEPAAPFVYPAADDENNDGFQDEDPLLSRTGDDNDDNNNNNEGGEGARGGGDDDEPKNIAHDPMIKPLIIYIVVAIVIACVLFPILFLVVLPNRNDDNNNNNNNQEKEEQATKEPVRDIAVPRTPAPTPFEWEVDLPDDWEATIKQESTSSIAQAYEWVANDPFLARYSEEQRRQRMGLAGLYYATGGDEWIQDGSRKWLNYWAGECKWVGVGCGDTQPISTLPPSADGQAANASGNIFEQGKRLRRNLQEAAPAEGGSPSKPFDRVISLQLSNINMNGTIPLEFSLLTDLTQLDISMNPLLTGVLPDWLCGINELSFTCQPLCGCDCSCSSNIGNESSTVAPTMMNGTGVGDAIGTTPPTGVGDAVGTTPPTVTSSINGTAGVEDTGTISPTNVTTAPGSSAATDPPVFVNSTAPPISNRTA